MVFKQVQMYLRVLRSERLRVLRRQRVCLSEDLDEMQAETGGVRQHIPQ